MKEINFLDPEIRRRYPQTDIGTSRLFMDAFKDELIYCADQDTWYVYNGRNWEADVQLMRNEFIKQLAEFCIKVVFKNAVADDQTKLLQYYAKLSDKNFRDKIIRDSMSIRPRKTSSFNRYKMLFNCQNGTYNFKTHEFKEHDRNDFLTDISNVTYDPDADCPMFRKYLTEVMQDDAIKMDYIMKISAYCLTGDTSRECFFIFYGDKTRNGKGTFVSTLTHLAGTYAATLKPAAITRKTLNSGASNASPEIAKLIASRLVSVSELEDGMMLDVALVKTLTGGDTMTARKLYKEEFEFIPQFKILINTNVLPRMTDDSIFRSDRLHILQFDRHFELEERDMELKEKLKTELSGIFNLLINSYQALQTEGFIVPDQSRKTVEKYHLASNNIMAFMQEKLYPSNSDYMKVSTAYQAYTDWCSESGYAPTGKKVFKERMERLGAVFTGKISRKNESGQNENTYWMNGFSFEPPGTEQLTIPGTNIQGVEIKAAKLPFKEGDLPY